MGNTQTSQVRGAEQGAPGLFTTCAFLYHLADKLGSSNSAISKANILNYQWLSLSYNIVNSANS